ncbi:hypothetical protein G9F72_016700 [Clostridium estertheticum]|uniref:hypothetical protein n=1 Tax=Clostridium estertheticum TaxID=238834 RepID=UPI0013E92415|nr:hypothetical protein [Clostridium estertheticum]MBZ9687972.1 hypothetical protein [Clostridium estertheticum]
MKKLLKNAFVLLVFCVLLLSAHTSYAFESRNDEVVSANKVWNIQFNKELKYDNALKQSITIVDSVGTIIDTKLELGKDMQSIIIKPPAKGYTLGKMYTLKIATDIYSKDNMKLQEPIQMNFKINNNVLVENNENLKVIFNDNCSSIFDSGWSKSLDNSQQSFISDFSEHNKYITNVPYEQYLFYNSSQNSIMQLSKNVEIGAGPFNIEFDAKMVDLQTPSKNSGWRGFAIDAIANNKRYRLSFNSKDSDNKIKINLMNKASGDGSFQTVDAYLPKDDNIHRWSIKNNGNNTISILLDGNNIANFYDPELVSTGLNDRVILYNDMTDATTGINQIYIENFAITKSLTIKDFTVIADENKQTVNASISMNIEDEKLILEKHYIIKCSLYKNDKIVAEDTKTLDNKNISFTLNNITQSGEMKVVATVIAVDKKIDEISKIINLNVATVNLEPGQTISSQPGKVYLYNKMDKMLTNDQNDAQHSGWELETYTDYDTNKTGTILENVENALPINIPIKLNGWFRVYVGYVTGTESFKIGQTDGSSMLQINGDISLASNELYGDQFINEKSTIISNFNSSSIKIFPSSSQRARIAYIKLVGLTDEQISIYGLQSENKKTVLYDLDGYSAFFDGSYPNIETLKSRTVDILSGRNVGELNWCLGTTGMLNYNSKYAGNAFEGLEAYDDQLRDGDKLAKYQILNILSSGKSPLEILADRGQEKGMKVNASFRMDTFYNPLIYGFLNGAMYNEYNKFTQLGSYELDYKYPEVRAYIKNILLESASFNNVSGITLDFCRYPTIFGPETSNEEKILIMNEFLRGLRRELPKNKTITIRVPYNEPIKYGYDINTWIKEGLLNRLIPSSIGREEYFNIKPYVDMVKNTNVQLYIGISADVSGHDITKEEEELIKQGLYVNNKVYLDVQQYLLRACAVYKAGADGVFLFNSSSSLLVDNNAPIESTFIGDKSLIQKWREFDYASGFMINKINVQKPTF